MLLWVYFWGFFGFFSVFLFFFILLHLHQFTEITDVVKLTFDGHFMNKKHNVHFNFLLYFTGPSSWLIHNLKFQSHTFIIGRYWNITWRFFSFLICEQAQYIYIGSWFIAVLIILPKKRRSKTPWLAIVNMFTLRKQACVVNKFLCKMHFTIPKINVQQHVFFFKLIVPNSLSMLMRL